MATLDDFPALFAPLSIWLSARIPDRRCIAEVIRAHGGRVVLRESAADVLLATQDAPIDGALFFSWVTDSVDEGVLMEKESYLLSRHKKDTVATAKRPRPKTTRTPFTRADDEALKEWTRGRAGTAGNGIYKELELVVSVLFLFWGLRASYCVVV